MDLERNGGFVEEHAEQREKHSGENVEFIREKTAVVRRLRNPRVAVGSHIATNPVGALFVEIRDGGGDGGDHILA